MSLSWRARWRRLRLALLSGLAIVVIVLGVMAGLTQLGMPWLAQHPQYVERWLSARLERPVTIGHLSGRWVGGGPLLGLDEVRIEARHGGQRAMRIPRAELAFDLYALFKRNSAMTEFRVSGLDLRLVNEDGGWRLHGIDLDPAESPSEPFSLGALGAVEISQLRLTIEDAQRDLHVALEVPVLRLLNRGAVTRALGRVRLGGTDSPPLDLIADFDPARRAGDIYLGGSDIDLARLAAQQAQGGIALAAGHGAVHLWARIHAGDVDDVRLRVDVADVQMQAASVVALDAATQVAPRVAFERLAFVARWLRDTSGWTFDMADLVVDGATSSAAGARATVQRLGDDAQPRWRAAATDLPLQPLAAVAMLAEAVPAGLRHWLYLASPRGALARAQLDWNSSDDYNLEAELRELALASGGSVPGVERIDLDVLGDAEALLLHVPTQALQVNYPHVFRRPFLFAHLGGDVVAQRVDGLWQFATDSVDFEGEGYAGELRGRVALGDEGKAPFVDLYAAVTQGQVVAAKLFWPTPTMPPSAMAWLDRGLVDGRIVQGRAALRGHLGEWPFEQLGGRMIARAELADLVLDYHPDWPRANKVHAIATFINESVDVDADAIETRGNRVTSARAVIDSFDRMVLELSAKGEGSGAHLLDFLRATPIGKRYQEHLQGLAIGGKGSVAFTLSLPLHHTEGAILDGSVDLRATSLDQKDYDLHFTDTSGTLHFSQSGFSSGPMDVLFRGRKAKLALAIGSAVADPRHVFEASLGGRFPAATVFADVPALLPLLTDVRGDSAWTARVAVADAPASAAARVTLTLDSDLLGTSIGLPQPLAKAAGVALPLHVELPLPHAGQVFSARLGDRAEIKGRLPAASQAFAGRVHFGGGAVGALPAQGIVIDGRMPQLDGDGWLSAFGDGEGSAGLVRSIDIRADDLLLAKRHFSDMRLRIDSTAQGSTIDLDGAALSGRLEIPAPAHHNPLITATFARVYWPDAPPGAEGSASALPSIAPAAVPPLRLSVDDFRLGTASFGLARFESRPIAGGMRIDKLETHSPNVTMIASGDWRGSASSNQSRMAIELTAQNLGHMMAALGFPGLIDGGATKGIIDASWPGPPSAFTLPTLDGTLDITVAEGRIPEVEPGAGRIFGLLSLSEIPRRLSLDFSDFFQSGLSFNSIAGKFRLSDGDAFTDGLTIKSPAADIVIRGRTGLRAKDYDQTMDVTPHAGSALPVVGALAAGPLGAAAGLVVQGMLSKPLGRAIERRYRVSGSWAKPSLVLEKQGAGNRESGKGKRPAAAKR